MIEGYLIGFCFQEDRFFPYNEGILRYFPGDAGNSFIEIGELFDDESTQGEKFFQLRKSIDMIESL